MFKSSTRNTSGQVFWMSLLATLGLAAAPAFADETYVLDGSAGTNGSGALYRVDAASGIAASSRISATPLRVRSVSTPKSRPGGGRHRPGHRH